MLIGKSEKQRGFTRIGKLRLGMKHPEKGYPMALDYFRVDAVNSAEVAALYGAEAKTLPVYLPDELNESVWDAHWKMYNAAGLQCMGNGEVGRYLEDDEWKTRDCANKGCPFSIATEEGGKRKAPKCGPRGFLMLKIQDVDTIGAYQLPVNGMMNINNCDGFLSALEATAGSAKGVPFQIAIVEEKRDGKKFNRLDFSETEETHRFIAARRKAGKALPQAQNGKTVTVSHEDGDYEVPVDWKEALRIEIRGAISMGVLIGGQAKASEDMLKKIDGMSEDQAEEKAKGLLKYIDEYTETLEEFVEGFPKEHAIAKHTWEQAQGGDIDLLLPETWQELTRRELRELYARLNLGKSNPA